MRRTAAITGALLITATMLTACGGDETSDEEEEFALVVECGRERTQAEEELKQQFDPLVESAQESYTSGEMSFDELKELTARRRAALDSLKGPYEACLKGEAYVPPPPPAFPCERAAGEINELTKDLLQTGADWREIASLQRMRSTYVSEGCDREEIEFWPWED